MLPYFVQYRIFAPIVYLFMYKVFRYRTKVVNDNLRRSFPDYTHEQRRQIRRKFYWYLCDIFVSSLAMASPKMGDKFDDPNDKECEVSKLSEEVRKRNCIGLTAHYGLWEHFVFWGEFSKTYMVGAYRSLKNPVMDELFIRLRTRNHRYSIVVERKHIARFCIRHREGIEGCNYILGLIADQNPNVYTDTHWIDFLGQDTVFYEGGAKLALMMKFPVYFVYQKQIGRGRYRFAYHLIHDGEEPIEAYEITRRYVRRLEEEIRRNPHLWLWTHKRWKHKR